MNLIKNVFIICMIIINIILLIILYHIYLVGNSKKCDDFNIYKKIKTSDMLNFAKPGDLLLFSNLKCNLVTRTFGDPTFSHIGLIYEKNNKLYTLEMVKDDYVYPGKERYKNIISIPIEDRVKYYSGYVYYAQLKNKLTKEQEVKLIEYSKKEFSFLDIFDFNLSDKKVCSLYIANILEDLNIANNLITNIFWRAHTNIIKLCNNTIYSYPIQIISDDFLIDNPNNSTILNQC